MSRAESLPDGMPDRIGPYHVLDLLGEGGMGSVYLAEDHELAMRVAIKVVKLGMDTRWALARFEQERALLALMDHDGIAKAFAAGATALGQPYFVMEYVPGIPIVEYCDDRRLSIRQRLELFCEVCDAVQHAHQKRVIHRDLKPTNILVRETLDRPSVKIIDFGLARALDPHGTGHTVFTEPGHWLGTLEYMSPEQAGAEPDIDTRTDVYALGVLLYELLTGELPFPTPQLRGAGVLEAQRILREVEPPSPSSRIAAAGDDSWAPEARGTTSDRLFRLVTHDLDWVTMRALEKDRRRRYATASALAEDVQRYLADEPVRAGPPSRSYRLRKWARRHRYALLVVSVMASCALLATVYVVQQRRQTEQAQRDRDRAERRSLHLGLGARIDRLLLEADQDAWPMDARGVPKMQVWLAEARALPGYRAGLVEIVEESSTEQAGDGAQDLVERRVAEQQRDNAATALQRLTRLEKALGEVEDRIAKAAAVDRRAREDFTAGWADAIAAVAADPRFAGYRLRQIPGLAPLGTNAAGLQEFVLLASCEGGDLPMRGGDGTYDVTADTGIIFILVPPTPPDGFWMGASREAGAHNLDPWAEPAESPEEEVCLDPCLLSRYEMTREQWIRLRKEFDLPEWGLELSTDDRDAVETCNAVWDERDKGHERACPVQQQSWRDCELLLRRWALRMPSEAQWEWACRAGTTTPWHFGAEVAELGRYGNVADKTTIDRATGWVADPRVDDGYMWPARVGRYLPNDWGFHDMIGNVAEFCIDGYTEKKETPRRRSDGRRGDAHQGHRCKVRGGSFREPWTKSRSAASVPEIIDNTTMVIGVRPLVDLPRGFFAL